MATTPRWPGKNILVTRRGGWSKGNSMHTSYSIADAQSLKNISDGFLANPAMSETIKNRHRGLLGSATIVWGAAITLLGQ